jgi:hypothetical protein
MSELQDEVGDDDKVVFYVTLKYKYEKTGSDLRAYYDTRNLREAADIDQDNFQEYPEFISEDINQYGRPFTVTVNAARVTD